MGSDLNASLTVVGETTETCFVYLKEGKQHSSRLMKTDDFSRKFAYFLHLFLLFTFVPINKAENGIGGFRKMERRLDYYEEV